MWCWTLRLKIYLRIQWFRVWLLKEGSQDLLVNPMILTQGLFISSNCKYSLGSWAILRFFLLTEILSLLTSLTGWLWSMTRPHPESHFSVQINKHTPIHWFHGHGLVSPVSSPTALVPCSPNLLLVLYCPLDSRGDLVCLIYYGSPSCYVYKGNILFIQLETFWLEKIS